MNSQADSSSTAAADGQPVPNPPTESGAPQAANPAIEAAPETTLEMRQVAGLTAGSVMVLRDGSFQFRESEKEVGFSLVVDGPQNVTVINGSATSTIDEIVVEEPTPLGDSVLNVGSACFTVREPRPAPSNEERLENLEANRKPPPAITVPVFDSAAGAPVQTRSSRFGSLFSRGAEEEQAGFDAQTWQFLESIRDTRSFVADRHRKLHPDPEELHSRLTRMDPGLWDRTVEHPMFARFPIAFSTIPWEPRFDEPERIPETLYEPIQEMSCLPWVPITANLLFGPLGIVGGRSAVLSCARNAVLYLACLTSPADIEFSIVTAQGLVEDWNWSSSLPNSLFPNGENKYCVAIADGMTHFEGAGFAHEAVKKNEMGLIVLADSVDDLPDYCGTVLELTSDGQCRVTNHLGEQVTGTPIGVTVSFAASLAGIVREAVGDGPIDDEEPELGQAATATKKVAAPVSNPPTQELPESGGPDGQETDDHAATAGPTEDADGWDEVPNIDDLIDLDDDTKAEATSEAAATTEAHTAEEDDSAGDDSAEDLSLETSLDGINTEDEIEFENELDAVGGDEFDHDLLEDGGLGDTAGLADDEEDDLDSLAAEVKRAVEAEGIPESQ